MNIFALYKCPVKSAQHMIDKHVVKMPTESCQMLHTNALHYRFVCEKGFEPSLRQLKEFHTEIGSHLMKPAMLNHPSTVWARESPANARWLYTHSIALCEEYTGRYNKTHGSEKRILDTPQDLMEHEGELTVLRIAMADGYRIPVEDEYDWNYVIKSYRHYYLEGKYDFATWKRNRPDWFPADWAKQKYEQQMKKWRNMK